MQLSAWSCVVAAALLGCSREGSHEASARVAPSVSLAASNRGTTEPPRQREFAETPRERLGVLPPGLGVPVGKSPADAVIQDIEGAAVDLAQLAEARGPLLIAFYRGGWCPYCNFEIHELSMAFPEYQRRGVLPVAISVDRVSEASKTAATYTIPFPVLSDQDLKAHLAFGVIHAAAAAETLKLKSMGLDIEQSSGRDHHKFAVPALFVVDRAFTVRWAHADPDYKVRPRTEQILSILDGLKL